MKTNNKYTLRLSACALALILNPSHGIELFNGKVGNEQVKVSVGGYAKVDVRHVEGDIAYQDYWIGNFPGGEAIETSHTGFNVGESRLNMAVSIGEVSTFIEVDMYGGGGNEAVSNSTNLRLRHFFITYKNWSAGQNWSTFMPLHVIPESLDFGGPHVGEVFARQVQVRYTSGNWQFAIESPETIGDGDTDAPANAVGLTGVAADPDESTPDFVVRYNLDSQYGQYAFGSVIRLVDQGGVEEVTAAVNIAGKIPLFAKDDLRFQLTAGTPGRYAAAGMTADVVEDPATQTLETESTLAYTVAYRHFWTETLRSTVFYGAAKTDILGRKRSHWAVNVIDTVAPRLDVGLEFGAYSINDDNIDSIDSNYFQASAKFAF